MSGLNELKAEFENIRTKTQGNISPEYLLKLVKRKRNLVTLIQQKEAEVEQERLRALRSAQRNAWLETYVGSTDEEIQEKIKSLKEKRLAASIKLTNAKEEFIKLGYPKSVNGLRVIPPEMNENEKRIIDEYKAADKELKFIIDELRRFDGTKYTLVRQGQEMGGKRKTKHRRKKNKSSRSKRK
jgi:hypothetical protein